jgi:K+-transporting ATPase KdpF subunit
MKNKTINKSMKTKIPISLMSMIVVPTQSASAVSNGPVSYLIGGIVALVIMGYLIYTLLHPEKF